MPFALHPRSQAIDQRHDPGPFDIVGDVHGCADELEQLLDRLGYSQDTSGLWTSATGRTPVFLGDLVDRGPRIADAIRIPMAMVAAGTGFVVPGNHDLQLSRYLAGETVPIVYGLDTSISTLASEPPSFSADVVAFFTAVKGHYVFDDGRLVVAHTGLPESLQGIDTEATRHLAAYGVAPGETVPGEPDRRHAWVQGYAGRAAVVYGHTKVVEPVWRGNSIDIDTGCVFGWKLTALRWPERELVSVPARAEYMASERFRSLWPPAPPGHGDASPT